MKETLTIVPDSAIPRFKQGSRFVSSVKSSLCNLGVMLNSSLSLGCYVRSGTCLFYLRGIFLLQNFGMSCFIVSDGAFKNG